jgi:fructan beta-fructosidase
VVPTENWRSAMTVARSLQLEPTEAGLRLSSQPVEELKNIHGARHTLKEQEVSGSLNVSEALSFSSPTFALKLELETAEASEGFAILLSNTQGQTLRLGYDAGRNEYFIDRSQVGGKEFSEEFPGVHWAPRFGTGRRHSIELLADLASVEFFADGGKTVMTDILFPEEPVSRISLEATGGTLQLKSAEVIELKSIWTAKNED